MQTLVLFAVFLLGSVSSVPSGEAALRTAAELDAFSDDTRRRYTPFCVTGTVQAVDAENRLVVFTDPSGWAEVRNDSGHSPVPGERVAMSGFAHLSAHQETDIVVQDMRHVCTDTVAAPLELRLRDISERSHHLHTIATEGTVIDTFRDEIDVKNQFMILKDADVVLPVALPVEQSCASDLECLRDARVRIRGRFMRTVSGERKFSGPFISIDGRKDIAVLVPAPADPFAVPPLEKKLYRTPREIAKLGKRSIFGDVLAVWGENQLMLQVSDGRIVNVTLSHDQKLPKPGTCVTVAGYPETDLYQINLAKAVCRPEPSRAALPDPEPETDLGKVFPSNNGHASIDRSFHGRLLRITGLVQDVPTPASPDRRMLLKCGPYLMPVELGELADADVVPGSVVTVTGRCLMESGRWQPDNIFPRTQDVVLVIRSPQDIRILSTPSWWTPQRLMIVIAALVAALIGVYIWNRVLRRLVERRSRALFREQVAHVASELKIGERTRLAVELHDSLSQTLAGIACQIAATDNAIGCDSEAAKERIKTAERMLKSCRTELRHCLFDLRSDTLEESDFSTAIRRTLDQLEGDADISVRFNVDRSRFLDSTAHAILAIIRELTGNAIRHGQAKSVRIAGCLDSGSVLFSVRDDGGGFDPATCAGSLQGHFGLEGIRDRVRKHGGTFTIDSRPGAGAKASIRIPLTKKEGAQAP